MADLELELARERENSVSLKSQLEKEIGALSQLQSEFEFEQILSAELKTQLEMETAESAEARNQLESLLTPSRASRRGTEERGATALFTRLKCEFGCMQISGMFKQKGATGAIFFTPSKEVLTLFSLHQSLETLTS